MSRTEILLYNGPGASIQPMLNALETEIDQRRTPIRLVTAADLADGRVLKTALALVQPGGEDRFYCSDLAGAAEDNIRQAVADGMGYLGSCAGAYYGGGGIRYHEGLPDEVIADRLGLVPVTAIGSIREFGPAYDKTMNSSAIVRLTGAAHEPGVYSYYHGGPYFMPTENSSVTVLQRYADHPEQPAAIVSARFGLGRAVLMGAHIELSQQHLSQHLAARRDGAVYNHMVPMLGKTEPARRGMFRDIVQSFGVTLQPVQPAPIAVMESLVHSIGDYGRSPLVQLVV